MRRWDNIVNTKNENHDDVYQFGYISAEDSSFSAIGETYTHSDAVLCSKVPEMCKALQDVRDIILDFLAGKAGDYDLQKEAEKINSLMEKIHYD